MYKQDSALEAGKSAIIRMIEKIREDSESQDFIVRHKRKVIDFSRKRDFQFGDVIKFVLGKSGTSLYFDVLNYFQDDETSVSSSAVCQARDKVNYTAFEELLKETCTEIPVDRVFKGYRLLAATSENCDKCRSYSI